MKRAIGVLLMAAVVAVCAQAASASYAVTGDYIKIANHHGTSFPGGPFDLTFVPAAKSGFITFCLEKSENIQYGKTYYVTVEDYAIKGGADNNDLAPFNGDANKDYLSLAAGYLYETFRTTGLAGKVAGWTGGTNDLIALQEAFWALEDERADPKPADAGSMFKKLFDWAIANQKANSAKVINVWGLKSDGRTPDFTKYQQSLLTLVPQHRVPEPASVAVWSVVAGVFGVGAYARRRRSKK